MSDQALHETLAELHQTLAELHSATPEAVSPALRELADVLDGLHPHLDSGSKQPEQITDVKGMSAEQIVEARRQGQLDKLLGRPSE